LSLVVDADYKVRMISYKRANNSVTTIQNYGTYIVQNFVDPGDYGDYDEYEYGDQEE